MAVALRALDATVEALGPDGATRTIPIADFHRLPGDTPDIETALSAGEMIMAVTLPPPVGGMQVYRKVRERASYAFANVSVALVGSPAGSNRARSRSAGSRPSRGGSRRPRRGCRRRRGHRARGRDANTGQCATSSTSPGARWRRHWPTRAAEAAP